MFNLIRFLFGARAVSEDALNLANQVMGQAMYSMACKEEPGFESTDADYLTNDYLREITDKIFAGRQKELLQIKRNIAIQLDKLLK